jgi:hypothetical protein
LKESLNTRELGKLYPTFSACIAGRVSLRDSVAWRT